MSLPTEATPDFNLAALQSYLVEQMPEVSGDLAIKQSPLDKVIRRIN